MKAAVVIVVASGLALLGCSSSEPTTSSAAKTRASTRAESPPRALRSIEVQAAGMRVIIRPQRADEAFDYLIQVLRQMPFYRQNGYQVALPDHDVFQRLAAPNAAIPADLGALRETFNSSVYNPADLDAAMNALAGIEPILERVLGRFRSLEQAWSFRLYPRYEVVLTLYGPGGSYDPDTARITLFARSDGTFKGGGGPHTIVHEMTHLGIEESIVARYSLLHWEKERVVDQLCLQKLGDILDGYRLQSRGNEQLDRFLDAAAMTDLPRAVAAYVAAYPR